VPYAHDQASNLVDFSSGVSPYSARDLPEWANMRPSSESGPGGTTVKDLIKDFKAFVLRGNVVDLAIAVVIGAAFGTVVTALVRDLITPILAIPGKRDFGALSFTIRNSEFLYGDFLNAVISFVSIAAAVFFFVVRPVNTLMARRKTEPDVMSTTRDCPYCLSSIPIAASRCAFCTADVGAAG
jgi:large conductance mechanosensitive channel